MNGFYITNLDDNYKGGLFYATYERIKRHSQNLNNITVVNNNFYERSESEYRYKEIKIINMNFKRTIGYIIDKFIMSRQEDRLISTYISKFNSELMDSDFIHAHWGWPNGYIAYKLSEKYNIPYFITLHGSDINNLKERNRENMLKAMENATKCFFVSKALLSSAKEKGYSGKNSVINYNGVDLSQFQLKNRRSKTIGYVGTLSEKKGADFLPKIFKYISESKKDYNYTIIGEGRIKEKLSKELNELGINDKVQLLGEISKDQVSEMMRSFDLVIMPSRIEGLGMVALEANACGVPVVGSNSGGIPEAIGISANCFPIDKNFCMNVSRRAIEILNDSNYENESVRLRERIKKNFTWEKVVHQEYEFYLNSLPKM